MGNSNHHDNNSGVEKKEIIKNSNSIILYHSQIVTPLKKGNNFLNLSNLYVPSYQITTSKVPVAIIFAPGKQLLVRKLPPNSKYFVDPDWGLFEIKPEYVHFMNKTPVYFFDTRNQNPFSPELLAELSRWANTNKMTKITRKSIMQGIKLRTLSKKELEKQNRLDVEKMTVKIKSLQKEISQHNENISQTQENEDPAGLEGETGELAPISEIQTNYLIIKQLATESYITEEDSVILQEKIQNKTLTFEGMVDYIKDTKLIEISAALPHGLDLIAENFHTYEPKDAINIMVSLSKLNKGFKGLRTTKPKNWFPASYLLFAMVGVIMLLQFLNGFDISTITNGFNVGIP